MVKNFVEKKRENVEKNNLMVQEDNPNKPDESQTLQTPTMNN